MPVITTGFNVLSAQAEMIPIGRIGMTGLTSVLSAQAEMILDNRIRFGL